MPIDTTNPIDLLFAADRNLRDAATRYADEVGQVADLDNPDARERACEDALRQAALDYAAIDNAITGAARYAIALTPEALARLTGE